MRYVRMPIEVESPEEYGYGAIRYNLEQVTPHMPGYILHVLIGRGLYYLIGDLNRAFVWESVLLSIGSVLAMWRAGAWLRGERLGVVAGGGVTATMPSRKYTPGLLGGGPFEPARVQAEPGRVRRLAVSAWTGPSRTRR